MKACRATGGLARADELRRRLGLSQAETNRQLNLWASERRICHLGWRGRLWLPMFQFAGPGMAPQPAVAMAVAEWRGVLADAALCLWFVQPNGALAGLSPAQVIADTKAVCIAARRNRRLRQA